MVKLKMKGVGKVIYEKDLTNNIDKTIIFGGKFGYGIPDDLIEKRDSFWLPIGNVKFETTKRHYRRRHNQTCPWCGEKKKNIHRHYHLYHKKEEYLIVDFRDLIAYET